MSTKPPANSSHPAAPPSIDAVVETPVAKLTEALRGPLAKLRPAWIGPKLPNRPVTSGRPIMTMPITIEFGSPGLQPPVYIATSLSDPQWEPIEMEPSRNESGEYTFTKKFDAQEGEYQYKLRLGPGDWWTCDDSKPQVDDGMGNKNNLVTVKPGDSHGGRADSVHEHGTPLMPHESHDTAARTSPFLQIEHTGAPVTPGVEHQAPFFRHESLVPEAVQEDDEEDDDDDETHSPLLRHETASPAHEAVSPLFRHESTAIDDQKHEDSSNKSPLLRGRKHSGDSIPEEADPNEPGLEMFPTDHRGIIDSIVRAKESLATDETSDHTPSPSPPRAAAASPRLASLAEAEDEEQLDSVRDVPDVQILEADNRPAAPITPPETPTKEKQSDPISERVLENVQSAKATAASVAEQAAQKVSTPNYSAVLSGSVFAFAVALTAIGLWYFGEGGKNLDMLET